MGSQHVKDEVQPPVGDLRPSSFSLHPCLRPIAERDPRDIFAALADGATALRWLAREVAYDANRFANQGARDRMAVNAHARYERQRAHALLLDILADELALVNARAQLNAAAAIVTPDEAHT
jgi:hypothetical protein